MKCLIFITALTLLCVFCVNASTTVKMEDSQNPRLSAKTSNIDEKNHVKRSIKSKQYRLSDLPAKINRFVENAYARNRKHLTALKEMTVQSLVTATDNYSACSPSLIDVQLIEKTAINNTKMCYQPLKDFATNYPANRTDFQISERAYNLFQSCQPDNKTVILNAVDCVNATMKKQQLVDPMIRCLLETIKNVETAVKNSKVCEQQAYDKAIGSMLKMAEDVDECTGANKVPSSNDNSENNKATELQRSLPINQLSTIVHEIGNLTFDSKTPFPWLDNKITEVTAEGPDYSHCIARKSIATITHSGINKALMCHKPYDNIAQEYLIRMLDLLFISNEANTIYDNCNVENEERPTVNLLECVNKKMAEQHIVDPVISPLLETLKKMDVLVENMKKCQLEVAKELESDAVKLFDEMDDCVIVTLVWNLFQ